MKTPLVGIIMGSKSDLEVMTEAATVLEKFGVPFEITIVSAHRTPKRMVGYASAAARRGLKVIIAGAGGSAHLPGMVASLTTLPVIGVPVKSRNSVDGLDSILSIVQMPPGVPVATVALNGAENAGILAAQIIALSDRKLEARLLQMKDGLRKKVEKSVHEIEKRGYKTILPRKR